MPINLDDNLAQLKLHKYLEFMPTPEIRALFLRNLSHSLKTKIELEFYLEDLDISDYHMKLLTSKDHEKFFIDKKLDFYKIKSLDPFRVSLIIQCPGDLLTNEILNLICFHGKGRSYSLNEEMNQAENLVNASYKNKNPAVVSQARNIALFIAAKNGYTNIVNDLITAVSPDNQLQIDQTNIYGSTPLMFAAENGHIKVARMLISKGADIHKSNSGGLNSLMYSAMKGHTEMARFLISEGADLNITDENKDYPLLLAAENRHIDVVRLLISEGARIDMANGAGLTPLIYAVKNGDIEMTRLLISEGADLNATDKFGSTLLMYAAEKGHTEMARFLVSEGAEIDKTDNNNNTPLMLAAMNERTEISRFLISKGADVNITNNVGETPLTYCVGNNDEEMILILINANADLNKPRKDGCTPLEVSFLEEYLELAELLLLKGADISKITDDKIDILNEAHNSISDENIIEIKEIMNKARLADKIYNMDIKDQQDLDLFNSSQFAKERFVSYCKTYGMPENFETRLKNLSNLTEQQIRQLQNIFETAGKFKDDVFKDFEIRYCELLHITDSENFPTSVPYSLLITLQGYKALTGEKDQGAKKAFESYKNNFALQPECIFNKLWDRNGYKEVIAMITKDIDQTNYEQRIGIGNNILYSLDKLIIEAPHQVVLNMFKFELRQKLQEIEASIKKPGNKIPTAPDLTMDEPGSKRSLHQDEVADDRSKFRRVATAEPTSFVDRVTKEPSDRSPSIQSTK